MGLNHSICVFIKGLYFPVLQNSGKILSKPFAEFKVWKDERKLFMEDDEGHFKIFYSLILDGEKKYSIRKNILFVFITS